MSFRKFIKKAGKVLKKAAPLAKLAGAAGLTALIPGGGAVLGAMKLASKLKSAGKTARDVYKPVGAARVSPPQIAAMINRSTIPTVQPRPVASGTFRPVRSTRQASAPAPRSRRRAASKAKGPTKAQLAGLYDQYIADGRPGDWQTYARSALSQ